MEEQALDVSRLSMPEWTAAMPPNDDRDDDDHERVGAVGDAADLLDQRRAQVPQRSIDDLERRFEAVACPFVPDVLLFPFRVEGDVDRSDLGRLKRASVVQCVHLRVRHLSGNDQRHHMLGDRFKRSGDRRHLGEHYTRIGSHRSRDSSDRARAERMSSPLMERRHGDGEESVVADHRRQALRETSGRSILGSP